MTRTPLIAFRCRPESLRAALEADAGGNVTACATEREAVANPAPELFSEFRSKCYTVRLTAADKCYTVTPSDSTRHRTKEHDDDDCDTDDSRDH